MRRRLARGVNRVAEAFVHWVRRRNPVYRETFDRFLHAPLESATQFAINVRRKDEGLALGEEREVPNEHALAQQIADHLSAFLRQTYPTGIAERPGNTKTYGVVRATFEVPDLPPELRAGIFREPRTYRAWVRFAGPGPIVTEDIIDNGILSIGIKLMGVEGEKLIDHERWTQDFTGLTVPTFTTPNVTENVKLQRRLVEGAPILYFLNPFDSHVRDFVMQGLYAKPRGNPLEAEYHSCTPILFGDGRAVQFLIRPRVHNRTKVPRRPSPDYLREAMVRTLDREDAVFDFLVQFQTDPHRMPIEDASVRWPERLSPFRRVATLTIPRQSFASAGQLAFARYLSYNPWHSIAGHRPLGNQNRARRLVYLQAARTRGEMNREPHVEPTGDETFED